MTMTEQHAEKVQPSSTSDVDIDTAAVDSVNRGMARTLRRIYNLTSDAAPRWNRKTKAKVRQMIRGMA